MGCTWARGCPAQVTQPGGMGQPPQGQTTGQRPRCAKQAGPRDGNARPQLGAVPLTPDHSWCLPRPHPWTPAAAACEGLAGGPCSRQAHPRPGPPGPRVLGNSMWGSQPCPSPPRSLDPLRPRQTGAEGQTRVYVAFCGTSCVPGTTLSNPPCLIHPRSESCAVLASEEEAEELAHGHTGCDVSSGGAFWHAWSSESQQAARGLCPQGDQGQ